MIAICYFNGVKRLLYEALNGVLTGLGDDDPTGELIKIQGSDYNFHGFIIIQPARIL